MTAIKPFQSAFKDLLSGNFSSLNEFIQVEDGSTQLFLNGRIYSTTPANLLLQYQKSGLNAFKKVDGDFTIFIITNEKIHIIRDRHGVGCQVFYSDNFATSRLADFTTLKGFECKPDYEALFTFLSIGFIPAPLCSLKAVKKLEAGHVLSIDSRSKKITDLFPVSEFLSNTNTCKLSIEEATIEYERLHKKAIKDRIGNAQKVGLLLSGGYDSGGNISALRDIYNGDVVSYSIGFKNNQWTELPLARLLSERYNSRHSDYEIEGPELYNLPKIIAQTGDPFQEGGLFVNYTAMELVRKSGENPALILGGDGNDQHFGTSAKELALHWKLKKNGVHGFQTMLDNLGNSSLFEKDNLLFRAEFHNRKILHVQRCEVFGFTMHELNDMNTTSYKVALPSYLSNHPKAFYTFDEFYYNRNLNIDIKQVINNVILFKSSRMSELFGNNMTFPYMSTELYEFLSTLPVEYKCRGTIDEMAKGKATAKFLHKNYLKPKLPTEITARKKQGGFAPLPLFLREEKQRKELFTYLQESDMVKALFDKKKVEIYLDKYNRTASSPGYWFWYQQVKANHIINMLTLAVWWDMYINRRTEIKSIKDLL